MHLLARYIVWELLKVFLTALVVLTGMVVLMGVAKEAVQQGLGPLPILRLIPYILPEALRFSVPATILLAVCCVYGRMSALNEVVAAKSLGISPMTLVWPALGIAFCVSLIAVWLNDIAVSWGRDGMRREVVQSVEEIAYGMLRTQRSYSGDRFSINVKDVQGRKLVSPTISFHGSESSPSVELVAQEAELRFNPDSDTLSIFLTNGSVDVEGQVRAYFPDRIERVIPLGNGKEGAKAGRRTPSNCPLGSISGEIISQRHQIRQLEESLAVEAAFHLATGDFSAVSSEQWHARAGSLASEKERMYRLKTEPWRRWANGFSCFFFCLVGAPLSVRLRKADYLAVFFMCFLPILIVYYPLMMLGVDRAKTGEFPPYAVWMGNAACLIAGLWLLRSTCRH